MGLLDEYDYTTPPVNMGLLGDTIKNYAKNVVTGKYAKRGLLDFTNNVQSVLDGNTQAAIDMGLNFNPMSALAIKAFHGSPYKFDQFKLDKIGTGEGAQAYGHGLYFAENPGVAANYQQNVVGSQGGVQKFLVNGKETSVSGLDDQAIYFSMLNGPDKASRYLDYLKVQYNDWMNRAADSSHPRSGMRLDKAKELDAQISKLSQMLRDKVEVKNASGNLYSVELKPNPEDLLDWDKPLSQQSEKVRKALSADPRIASLLASGKIDDMYQNSGEFYRALMSRYAQDKPAHIAMDAAENSAQADASKYLRSLGIPGIKYLDQGSRGSGQGTSNFVIFDDELVKILGRE